MLLSIRKHLSAFVGIGILSFYIVQLTGHFYQLSPNYAGSLIWLVWFCALTRLTPSIRKQCIIIYTFSCFFALIYFFSDGVFQVKNWLFTNLDILMLFSATSFLSLLHENTKQKVSREEKSGTHHSKHGLISTMCGLHLFGAIINLSIIYLIGDHFKRHSQGKLSPEQLLVLSRIFPTASHWSPFMISMAVTLVYAPELNLTLAIIFGFLFALTAMMGVIWDLRGEASAQFIGFPIRGLIMKVALALASSVIIGKIWRNEVNIIAWVALMTPLITLLFLQRWPWDPLIRSHVTENIPKIGDNVIIFLGAGLLSAGISGLLEQFNWSFEQYAKIGFMWYHAGILVLSIVSLSILSIHPLISVAVLAPLTEPFQPNQTLLGFSILMGWGIGSTINPLSASNLLISSRYQFKLNQLMKINGKHAVRQVLLSFLFAWLAQQIL